MFIKSFSESIAFEFFLQILLCIVGLLIAVGISMIRPPSYTPEIDPALYGLIEKQFELPSGNLVIERAHEGAIYVLEVYPNASEGGGFWALVQWLNTGLTVIDSGNKSESEIECAALDQYSVSDTLIEYCFDGSEYRNRATGAVTTYEEIQKDPHYLGNQDYTDHTNSR